MATRQKPYRYLMSLFLFTFHRIKSPGCKSDLPGKSSPQEAQSRFHPTVPGAFYSNPPQDQNEPQTSFWYLSAGSLSTRIPEKQGAGQHSSLPAKLHFLFFQNSPPYRRLRQTDMLQFSFFIFSGKCLYFLVRPIDIYRSCILIFFVFNLFCLLCLTFHQLC